MSTVMLKVTGRDDVGIVTQLSSIINKSKSAILRSISINSNGGTFMGTLGVSVKNEEMVSQLITKLKGVKGVYDVTRENRNIHYNQ